MDTGSHRDSDASEEPDAADADRSNADTGALNEREGRVPERETDCAFPAGDPTTDL